MPADTFSSTLGVLLMATGNDNNSWGTNCNNSVFQILEDAIANPLTSAVTGGTLDLSGSPPPSGPSQVRFNVLIFTGTLTSNQIVKVPNLNKFWWINNKTSGAFTLTVQTPSGSASTAVPQNSGLQTVYCDASNNITVSPFNWKQIQMPDASAAAPGFGFVNETNSGWYRHGTNDIRLAIGGVDLLQVTGAGGVPANSVQVLGTLNSIGSTLLPSGIETAYAGVVLPTGFLWEFGQTVSRTTYASLLAAIRIQFTGNWTNGNSTITITAGGDPRNLGLEGGVLESSTPGITNFTVNSLSSTTITMSNTATASSGGNVTFLIYPYGNGDGSTTFGIPDRRGRVLAGRDNMSTTPGAAAAGRLTSGGSGIAGVQLVASGGLETVGITIAQANLPSVNFTVSGITLNDPGHTHTIPTAVTVFNQNGSSQDQWTGISGAGQSTGSSTTGITISSQGSAASGGSGTAITHQNTQPTGISNWIIKT